MLTVTELNDVEVHQQSIGRAITGTDIGILLIKSRRDDAVIHGIHASQVQHIHHVTVRSYRMLSAVNKNKIIKNKVQQKTENRFIAENSIISTICYLFIVVCTHLLIGVPHPKYNHIKSNWLSKGARELIKLVSIANNNAPIYNVMPGLITSTDDTTVFVFKDATKVLEGWYLLNKSHSGGKQSSYSNDRDGTNNKNDLCVRLTFTRNEVGMMAAPFITVTGITNKTAQ